MFANWYPEVEVEKILISLDLTEEVVEEAIDNKVDMIVTHHPFIFKPLKSIRTDLASGKLIKNIIKMILIYILPIQI